MIVRNLRQRWQQNLGVIATEVAFLTPVVLVGVMMLFELVRVGLVVGVGSVALDKSVQSFRLDDLKASTTTQMADNLKSRIVDSSYGYLNNEDLTVSVLHFDNLSHLGGLAIATEEEEEEEETESNLPVWSVTVQIKKSFLTPLPEVLSLGEAFRYQYKHVFGTELMYEQD
ncbi:hypothetical protein [Klebsiella sp. BIGb0407]|uniref:hypothetical protein n=1 Tax=Klebsiella sp. BIGb0407 TaxID=2940603 RepID=UPI00216A2D97|nr:hypothetical protein [Klebsiella sp. BIGb0407]MCS3430171.1 hypothetical protein [Klebsiella sp. BIGb0407]